MAAPFIRTQYNLDATKNSDDTGLRCLDKTLTQQQFKEQTDINVLFGKYLETGEIPQVEGMAYGDFTGVFDFQTAMNAVRVAEESFQTLPARIKNRFDNNPQKLVEFLNDPENLEEARFLKLANPAPAPEAQAVAGGLPNTAQSTTSQLPADSDPGRGTDTTAKA